MLDHVGSRWITLEVAGLQESDVCMQPQVQHQKTNRKNYITWPLLFKVLTQESEAPAGSISWQNVESALRRQTHQCERLISTWISSCLLAGSIAWTQLGPTWKQHAKVQVSIKSASVWTCLHAAARVASERLIEKITSLGHCSSKCWLRNQKHLLFQSADKMLNPHCADRHISAKD